MLDIAKKSELCYTIALVDYFGYCIPGQIIIIWITMLAIEIEISILFSRKLTLLCTEIFDNVMQKVSSWIYANVWSCAGCLNSATLIETGCIK